MFSKERIAEILREKLPDARVIVRDDMNDGEHFSAEVSSSAFVGTGRVEQHQIVYAALGDHMKRDIHALQLKTYAPDRWPHADEV